MQGSDSVIPGDVVCPFLRRQPMVIVQLLGNFVLCSYMTAKGRKTEYQMLENVFPVKNQTSPGYL